MARPNVLRFDDDGFVAQREQEQMQRHGEFLAEVRRPVLLEIGAGTAIPSVRRYTELAWRNYGAALIRINPRDHKVMPVRGDLGLVCGGLRALQAIDRALLGA